MKSCLLFGFLVVLSFACFAQINGVKLYGFKQAVLKGVPSTYETDEQGKKLETKNEAYSNLFIYLSYPPGIKLFPVEVWINGKQYGVKEEVVQTPIQITYDNGSFEPERIILVPQTTDTVTRIIVAEKIPSKNSAVKKSLVEANEIVLVYKIKSRLYSQTLKKIKGLRTAIMQ